MALSALGQKLASSLKKATCLSTRVLAEDDDVEKAVGETVTKATDLDGVLKALGVDDPGKALEAIGALQSAKAQLDKTQAELAEKMAVVDQVEQAQASNDVGAALSAKGFDDAARPALESHRTKMLSDAVVKLGDKADHKAIGAARESARKAFLAHYGVPDDKSAKLLTMLTVDSRGSEVTMLSAPGRVEETSNIVTDDGKTIINVTPSDLGRNATERLCSALARTDVSFKAKPLDQQIRHVHTLRRSESVVIQGL
jgi:hypothetical protein